MWDGTWAWAGAAAQVAIKKIGGAFENVVDARRVLREIKLLRHLQHENVIGLRDVMRPRHRDTFQVRAARRRSAYQVA